MEDKELLEMAAKAAGKPLTYSGGVHWFGNQASWNPLTDDGDALRLLVRAMELYGFFTVLRMVMFAYKNNNMDVRDSLTATRRAIVRAAAAIGKEMP